MGFRTYVLALTTAALGMSARLSRVLAAVEDEHSADTPENEAYYRRLGTRRRDIGSADASRSIEDGVRSWQRDGYAARAVEVVKYYAVGTEPILATASAEDQSDREVVQRAIDAVWNDPRNRFSTSVLEFYDALSATGELCLVRAVGSESKLTRIGYVDPADIECVLQDPEDARCTIAVVRRPGLFRPDRIIHPVPDETGAYHERLRKGAAPDVPLDPGTQIEVPVGEGATATVCTVGQPAHYLGVNKLPNQSRGSSDLFRIFHVLDMLDRNVWGFGDRMRGLQAFIWEVETTAKGKEREDLLEHATEATKTAAGVFLHGPGTTIKAVTPSLGALDWKEAFGVLIGVLTTSTGIPPHFFTGEGGDVNLATAGELAGPFLAMVKNRQSAVRGYFGQVLLLAILQRPEIARMYADDPRRVAFDLSLPTVSSKDAVRAVTVLGAQLAALNSLRVNFGLKREAAIREGVAVGNEYGFELSPEDFEEEDPAGFRGEPLPGAGSGDPGDGARVNDEGQTSDERQQGSAAAA